MNQSKSCLEKTQNIRLTVLEVELKKPNLHDDCTELFPSAVWNLLKWFAHALLRFVPQAFRKTRGCFRKDFGKKTKSCSGNDSRRRPQPPRQNKGHSYRVSTRGEDICFKFVDLKRMWVWPPVPGPVQRADRTSAPQHKVDSREPQISR